MTAVGTAIYARISDDRQDGAGVDRQLKDCRALVKKQGWGGAIEFTDNDFSAYSGKRRPAYSELLSKVRTGEIERIVVYHADRLYRRPRELEDVPDLIKHDSLKIASVHSGEIDLSNSDGELVARMLVGVAAKESADKSRRIKSAKQQARERGLSSGGPTPFGWKATWTLDATMGKKRRVLSEDPGEVALIRAAISNLLNGASLRDIAERWNAAGVKQPQARSRRGWNAQGIRQLVSNPRLAGLIGHRVVKPARDGVASRYLPPEVVGKALLPGIVDRTQWEQLQAVLAERGANGHMPRRRSLLTGLVTCGKCGATMVRSGGRGSRGTEVRKVWRCMRGGGGHPSIDATGLENLLVEATLQRADTTALSALVRAQGRQGQQANELMAELRQNEERTDAAAESYAAGRLSTRAFEHATAELERRKSALQAKLAPLTSTAALEPYAGRRGVLRKAWPTLSIDQQRRIIAAALGPVSVSAVLKPGRPSFDKDRVMIHRAK
jgi:site-specific DNA recombinase